MSRAVAELLAILDLEQLEENLFRGRSPQIGWQRVFGGQVIGQALVAACRTVEGAQPHSLHGYFMLPGDPKVPIIYEVDRIRDGKSFTTRRVMAIQHGQAIFSMSASFHLDEQGFDAPDRDAERAAARRAAERGRGARRRSCRDAGARARLLRARAADRAAARRIRALSRRASRGEPRFHVWIRATGRLPDDPAIHQCVLAYASDMTLLDTALIAHGRTVFDRRSRRRASTTRCGSIGRSGPTNGCSMRRTARAPAAPAASPAAHFYAGRRRWSPRSPRKA